ncbi:MAG: hypothetical protein KC414_12795 [Romboutsia sp.]|nr:hypothetical protein [Romboutsia sp.]
MEINNTIKVNLLSVLNLTDKIVEKIEENKKKISDLIPEIISKDKKGENVNDKIITHRALMAYSMLLNEDLRKGLSQLSLYYTLSKINKIDLGIEKKDVDRLEFLSSKDSTYFAINKGKIVPKDVDLFQKIVDKIAANQENTSKEFLDSLRKSKMYGEQTS